MGMGGVMLESTEWAGGLRDRALPVSAEQRHAVEPELEATIERLASTVFKIHGLGTQPAACCSSTTRD